MPLPAHRTVPASLYLAKVGLEADGVTQPSLSRCSYADSYLIPDDLVRPFDLVQSRGKRCNQEDHSYGKVRMAADVLQHQKRCWLYSAALVASARLTLTASESHGISATFVPCVESSPRAFSRSPV